MRQVDSYYPVGMSIPSFSARVKESILKNEYLYKGGVFQDGIEKVKYVAGCNDVMHGCFHELDQNGRITL